MNRFIIVSGYHEIPGCGLDWFYRVWEKNTWLYVPQANRIFVISTSPLDSSFDKIDLDGDLGGCGHILYGHKPHFMPCCPAVWMAGLWLAYINESDFIYKEQDLLAFGDWVGEMYRQLGDKRAIFGSSPIHNIATSCFLVKHDFIPEFVQSYLSLGPENAHFRIAELKVLQMEEAMPHRFARYSFGYDTARPFNPDSPVFTVQKLTPGEMRVLASRGLVSIDGMPENVEMFSNHKP